MSTEPLIIDFGNTKDGHNWTPVNDTVMGGASHSSTTLTSTSLLFKGDVSLENNGGFASIRSADGLYDLSKFTKVSIRFKSKGRRFALRLAEANSTVRANYKHHFSSSTENWEERTMQLANFKYYHKGAMTEQNSKEGLVTIVRIGLILSDGQEGPFELEIDNINFS
tara:strand:- start:66089 stop:66589 length:501 start_codon:yes stop_codon:yes gene_type:complete